MKDGDALCGRTVEDLHEVACSVRADAEFSRPVAFRIELEEAYGELPSVFNICGRDSVPQRRTSNIHTKNIFQ